MGPRSISSIMNARTLWLANQYSDELEAHRRRYRQCRDTPCAEAQHLFGLAVPKARGGVPVLPPAKRRGVRPHPGTGIWLTSRARISTRPKLSGPEI